MTITQMIWFHDVHGPLAPLKTALATGRFTHALLSGLGFDDAPPLAPWRAALDVVRAAEVTPIYGRWLWPAYANFDPLDLFEHRWYGERLERLHDWAARDRVTLTALDLEPYGDNAARTWVNKGFARDKDGQLIPPLTELEYRSIRGLAELAVACCGAADYVLPGPLPWSRCVPQPEHLYRALRPLGKDAIAEHTYYDWEYPTWGTNGDDYDVFGAYCLANPAAQTDETLRNCYTPERLLGVAQRTRGRVMVYPGDVRQAGATAEAFARMQNAEGGMQNAGAEAKP